MGAYGLEWPKQLPLQGQYVCSLRDMVFKLEQAEARKITKYEKGPADS